MFTSIAGFELRYQLRWPVFWVTTLIFALLAYASIASTVVHIGSIGNVKANSPYAIVKVLQTLSVFAVFIVAAFVANVVVRDDDTNFGPIFRSTPVTKFSYLYGRFTGAFLVGCLAFAGVPLALLAGSLMPWVDPDTLGPFRWDHYAYAFFFLTVPTIFVISAFCFALATATRSVIGTYIGVILFLALFLAAALYFEKPEYEVSAAMYEPFGIGAFQLVTKYWTAAERNTQLPMIQGVILWNRAMWVGAGFVLLIFAGLAFRPRVRAPKPEPKVTLLPETVKTEVVASELPQARHNAATSRAQLFALVRFDVRSVFRSPAFYVLLGIGFVLSLTSVWIKDEIFGTPVYPVTRAMIEGLSSSFTMLALIIAIFYAGELVWRDRDRRIHEIVDACPAPDWSFVLPKILAIALVLLATVGISVIAGIAAQLVQGYTNLELEKYLLWYVLPEAVYMTLMAVLAVFIQVISPNKFVGWLVMLVFIVSRFVLTKAGFEHNLYHYGEAPPVPLSDMNGEGQFGITRAWFGAYWAAIAVLLVTFSHALWRRGIDARLFKRLRTFPSRLAGAPGVVAALALITAGALGAQIYYNTNILNEYRTQLDDDQWAADYERTLLSLVRIPQPRVEKVKLTVDLYPHNQRVVATGYYTVRNRTQEPINELHVHWMRDTQMRRLEISGATLKQDLPRFSYRVYHFDQPLEPDQHVDVRFTTIREQLGFLNSKNQHRIVDNGTYINSLEITPTIGVSRDEFLRDRTKRRKYGLVPELRAAKLEDENARNDSFIRRDSDWVQLDITVSTDANQTPVAPGHPLSDTITRGRRTIHYATDAPTMHLYSIQSAAYSVKREKWNNVDLAVYYDPTHPYNVDRMLKAMKSSLDYYTTQFSAFQFKQLRILEFPGYELSAQSFANTIPYSERIGFVSHHENPEDIDVVTYVTAHEVGHQWWAHQVIGGDVQGSAVLAETLSQYSALMVMEKTYGPNQIRRFLKSELDRYLRSRGGEILEEVPLERVENQPYIYYQKGSLAMYLLKDEIGEAAVNRALQGFLTQYAFKGPPYATSRDLIRYLRAEAGPDRQQLITDLFEKITLYDSKVKSASAHRRADGKWDVVMQVELHKLYADGQGHESEVSFAESFDVGAFTLEPGQRGFSSANVVSFERRDVHTGLQTIKWVTDREPKFVGIDPYNKRIDRNSEDNILPIGGTKRFLPHGTREAAVAAAENPTWSRINEATRP